MKLTAFVLSTVFGFISAQSVCPAGFYRSATTPLKTINFHISLTVDDIGAMYIGNDIEAVKYIGTAKDWAITKDLDTSIADYQYLYIAADNTGGPRALTAVFTNLENNANIYSNSTDIQVTSTGRSNVLGFDGRASDLVDINNQIALANQKKSLSQGWVRPY